MNRRRILYGGKEEDPYKDFVFGKITYNGIGLSDNSSYCVSPFFELTNHNYKIGGAAIRAIFLREGPSYRASTIINYGTEYTLSANTISIDLYKYIRLSIGLSHLDDAYILDSTTGKYLFKGKNVK